MGSMERTVATSVSVRTEHAATLRRATATVDRGGGDAGVTKVSHGTPGEVQDTIKDGGTQS